MTGRVVSVAEDLSRAKYELEAFLLRGEFDLYEDKQPIGSIDPVRCEAEIYYGKLIFSCWTDEWSRSWRVVSYEQGPDRLRLECTKQMRTASSCLDLRRGASLLETAQSRHEFAVALARIVEENLEGFRVERAIAARDDREHLSGVHARLVIRDGAATIAGIGTGDAEPQAHVDSTLGGGLIWLDSLRRSGPQIERLMIFVPRGRSTTVSTRATAITANGIRVSLYELDETAQTLHALSPCDQGDLADRLRRASLRAVWPREAPAEVRELISSFVEFDPASVESSLRGGWVVLSVKGLECARVSLKHGQVYYGIGDARKRLGAGDRRSLTELMRSIIGRRSAESTDTADPLYRLQSERWLESVIRRDITSIDPTLDPRFVYSQVPTYRGEQRTFIDLLAITRRGRLAVIELKVSEDSEFPLQALDYWQRVEWHRRRGDFERRGCFPGVKIADEPPLLHLVAPIFRFHATTRLIGSFVSARVPLYRIGINEDWRRGVSVLLRERLN